jgi:uracil-DNA glycosylase
MRGEVYRALSTIAWCRRRAARLKQGGGLLNAQAGALLVALQLRTSGNSSATGFIFLGSSVHLLLNGLGEVGLTRP